MISWRTSINTALSIESTPDDVLECSAHFNMGLHVWPEGRIKPGTFEPLTKAFVEVIQRNCQAQESSGPIALRDGQGQGESA